MNTNVTYDVALKTAFDVLFKDYEVHDQVEALTLLIAKIYNKPPTSVKYDLYSLEGKY